MSAYQPEEEGVRIASQVFVSVEKDYTHYVRKVRRGKRAFKVVFCLRS